MTKTIYAILLVTHRPSGKSETIVGYVDYLFDAATAITRLNAENPGQYVVTPVDRLV